MEQDNQNHQGQGSANTAPNAAPAPSPSADKKTLMIVLTYILFFIPLLTEEKNDPFFKYHARQSLGLLLCSVAVSVVARLFWIFSLASLLDLFIFVLWVLGLINALNGKQEPVPLLGKWFEKITWF